MTDLHDIGFLDYDGLKKYGLEYIQKIGHKKWTDYNVHDPGVTILEALCFSLVDLGYRTSFPIADLITPSGHSHPNLDSSVLFPAHEIFSFNPTTIDDYRKLVLENVPGVKNVKILNDNSFKVALPSGDASKPKNISVKGFYKVIIELEDKDIIFSDEVQQVVRRGPNGRYVKGYKTDYEKIFCHYVKNLLLKYRNLCEDFLEVVVSKPVPVGLCLELELDDRFSSMGLDENHLCQQVFSAVAEYVSPHIPLYSVPELLKKGKKPSEIYQGVIPRLGYIDMEELVAYDKKTELYISEIIPLIMDIQGIKSIKHIHFKINDLSVLAENPNPNDSLKLRDSRYYHFTLTPEFYVQGQTAQEGTVYNEVLLSKAWFTFYANPAGIDFKSRPRRYLKNFETMLPPIESQNRNTSTYYSFQNLLPQAYKMNHDSENIYLNDKEKIEKLQLKAYLTFFDQLLADYIAQLDALQSFFTIQETDSIDSTYMHHILSDQEIADVSMVLNNDSLESDDASNGSLSDLDRKNRLLDYLLALFNDSFADYAALMYALNRGNINEFSIKENIEDKKRYLKRYPSISGNRAKGHDYTEVWDMTGIEARILSRLGLNDLRKNYHLTPEVRHDSKKGLLFYDNCSEPFEDTFGLHIIEHILLVPHNGNLLTDNIKLDNEQGELVEDPYSFHVTVVLPGWLDVCQNRFFRTYVEKVIREEIPAHIVAKICWIGPDVMYELEKAYGKYISIMKLSEHPTESSQWRKDQKSAITSLIQVINGLENIYPVDYDNTVVAGSLDGGTILDHNVIENFRSWNFFTDKES